MPRNLDRRVEVLFPVRDPALRSLPARRRARDLPARQRPRAAHARRTARTTACGPRRGRAAAGQPGRAARRGHRAAQHGLTGPSRAPERMKPKSGCGGLLRSPSCRARASHAQMCAPPRVIMSSTGTRRARDWRDTTQMTAWRKICCAIDFSETSRAALEQAADLSFAFQGRVAARSRVARRPGLGVLFAPPGADSVLLRLMTASSSRHGHATRKRGHMGWRRQSSSAAIRRPRSLASHLSSAAT